MMMSLQWGCRCKMLVKYDARINVLLNNTPSVMMTNHRYASNNNNNNSNNSNNNNNSSNNISSNINNNSNNSNKNNNRKDRLKVLRCLASTTNAIHIHQKAVGSVLEDPVLNLHLWSSTDRGHCLEALDYGINNGSAVPPRPGKRDFIAKIKKNAAAAEVLGPSEMIKDAGVFENFVKQINAEDLEKWYRQLESESSSSVPSHVDKKVLDALIINGLNTAETQTFATRLFEGIIRNEEAADATMQCPLAETYSNYILGLLACKDHELNKRAYKTYLEMSEKKLRGPLQLYNGVLSLVLYSLNGHDRRDIVKSIVGKLVEYNIKPDVNTFINLMHVASHQKDGATDEIWRLKREMVALDIKPTFGVYYYLVKSLLEKYGGSRMGQKMWMKIYFEGILGEIETGNIDTTGRQRADKLCFQVMLEAGVEFKLKELVERLLECMLSNKTMIPWEYNFAHLIEYFRKSKHHTVDDVFDAYKQLVPTCFKPDGHTFIKVFLCMAEKGDFHHMPTVYNDYAALRIPIYLSFMQALVSIMNSRVPMEQRQHVLKFAENAFARFKTHPQYPDNQQHILTGFIYFRALTNKSIDAMISDCIDAQLCPQTILTTVLKRCAKKNETDAIALIKKTADARQIELPSVVMVVKTEQSNVVEDVGDVGQYEHLNRELNLN